MVHPPLPVVAEVVVAQAVVLRIDDLFEPCPQGCHLAGVELALEDAVLHPLPVVKAGLRHLAQSARASRRAGGDIVGDQDIHGSCSWFVVAWWCLLPKKGRVGVEVAAQVAGE